MNYNNVKVRNFKNILLQLSFVFLGLVLMMMASLSASAQNTENLLEIIQNEEEVSTFASAVTKAGLEDLLLSEGPNTIFVPNNEAFEALPDGVLDALLMDDNVEILKTVLNYHIVSQDLNSTQVLEGGSFEAVESTGDIVVSQDEDSVFLNEDSRIVRADFDGNNGYVHIIDKVLIPSSVDVNQYIIESTEVTPRTGGFDSVLGYSMLFTVVLVGGLFGFSGERFSSVTGVTSR